VGGVGAGGTRGLRGVAGGVVFGGAGPLAVVAVWWLVFPELRRIDRFAEASPDT